jgi:hypothetical protein
MEEENQEEYESRMSWLYKDYKIDAEQWKKRLHAPRKYSVRFKKAFNL